MEASAGVPHPEDTPANRSTRPGSSGTVSFSLFLRSQHSVTNVDCAELNEDGSLVHVSRGVMNVGTGFLNWSELKPARLELQRGAGRLGEGRRGERRRGEEFSFATLLAIRARPTKSTPMVPAASLISARAAASG